MERYEMKESPPPSPSHLLTPNLLFPLHQFLPVPDTNPFPKKKKKKMPDSVKNNVLSSIFANFENCVHLNGFVIFVFLSPPFPSPRL